MRLFKGFCKSVASLQLLRQLSNVFKHTFEVELITVNVVLLRALVKDGKNVIAQRLLVDPITLNLNLIRSLSTWNHNVPDIEVKGSLKSVKVCTL